MREKENKILREKQNSSQFLSEFVYFSEESEEEEILGFK